MVESFTPGPLAAAACLTPQEAAPRLAEFRVVDVREPTEFHDALGHVAPAELVPLASLAAAAAHWRRSQPLLVICRSGGRSGRAAAWLRAQGFATTDLAGGMLAWHQAGLPVCDRAPCRRGPS